jgi:transcription antitermination protein NusB
MLFQWDLGKDAPATIERLFWSNSRWIEDEHMRAFANRLFHGAVAAAPEIDEIIASRAAHWRMDRMAAVDRNVLRMAIYEMVHCRETPPVVVINEALEIGRRFSGDESVQFLNGVLDSVRKEIETPHPA